MRRPPTALMASLAVLLLASACQESSATKPQKAVAAGKNGPRVPYESTLPTDPPVTKAKTPKTTKPAASSDTSDPNVFEPVVTDVTPDSTSDVRSASDPLCRDAKKLVDLNAAYQKALSKALAIAPGNPKALVKALQKLPVNDLRRTYDDLSVILPTASLRRKVLVIRDYTVANGGKIQNVTDIEGLSQLIAEMEADPKTAAVKKATIDLSAYTDKECGISLVPATPSASGTTG